LTEPQISVVIPTRNAAAVIADCLRSVRAQVGVTLEILLVDSLSSDGTAQMGRELADAVIDLDCSMTRGRLIGAERATSKYVLNLDADQRLVPGALGRALELGKPIVAFGELALGRGIVAMAGRLEGRVRARTWVRQISGWSGSIIPRLYPRERLVSALRSLPPTILDCKPSPFSEDSLIFGIVGANREEVGFVPGGILHDVSIGLGEYWRKWAKYGKTAQVYRGTKYASMVRRRAEARLKGSSWSAATLPALLLRAPAFIAGYIS
jgi:hypothetical protein